MQITFTISIIEKMCFHCLVSFTVCDLILPPLSYIEITMELIHNVGYWVCNRISLGLHDALPNTGQPVLPS